MAALGSPAGLLGNGRLSGVRVDDDGCGGADAIG
jgi:hypothetical protein